MSETVRLSDYSPVPDDKAEYCRSLQSVLSENNNDVYIYDGKDLRPSDRPLQLFKQYNDKYMTRQYVGAVTYCGENGEIKFAFGSRFDSLDGQFFLQYVINETLGTNSRVFKDMEPAAAPEHTFDLLLMMVFITQLKQAVRKGIFRRYCRFERNDAKVRGSIDLGRHIKYNVMSDKGSNGKIAYSYREFTAANSVCVLILKALDMMERKYPEFIKQNMRDREMRSAVRIIQRHNPDWQAVKNHTVLSETRQRITHSLYRCYEPLRITARLILKHMGLDLYADKNRSRAFGLLIDMPKLWERFIENAVFKAYRIPVKAQREFDILNGSYKMTPDFYREDPKFVLDAKYRPAWEQWLDDKKGNNVGIREDLFQVLAYMYSLRCPAGGVVFPTKNPHEPEAFSPFAGREEGGERFWVFPLGVPESGASFAAFSRAFKENCKKLADAIKALK